MLLKIKWIIRLLSLQSKFKELGQILLDEHEEKIVETNKKRKNLHMRIHKLKC